MRISLQLGAPEGSPRPLTIPVNHYADWVQGAVYHTMEERIARTVHDTGFPAEGRSFRLFAYSRLLGNYRLSRGLIEFEWPVRLVVSSPLAVLAQNFTDALLHRPEIRIGPERCRVEQVAVEAEPEIGDELVVETLGPMTTHSTIQRQDGSPYTIYYHPKEREFSALVTANLARKYRAIYAKLWNSTEQHILVTPLGPSRLHVIRYRTTVIKGYTGRFRITGPPPLLSVGYAAGFGDRNSQGFGLVKMVHGERPRRGDVSHANRAAHPYGATTTPVRR